MFSLNFCLASFSLLVRHVTLKAVINLGNVQSLLFYISEQ